MLRTAAVLALALAVASDPIPNVDCVSAPQNGYPFCNPALSIDARVDDLMSRLTLPEMINQTWSIAPAIPRLGMKAYNWRSNCVHGWTDGPDPWPKDTCWTVFPNPMAMGATFDPSVPLAAGSITGTEGRALHNVAMASNGGASVEAAGLNCFSPNVNLYRDPRWGRNMEVFGEDTYHMGHMALQYTKGLQYDPASSKYLKVAACTKHYAAHDGPDNTRAYFVANVSTWNLFDTYLPSTEAQVLGGGVAQLMPAYSSLLSPGSPDSAPNCANPYLLKDILRGKFGGENVSVISDNGGIGMVYQTHKFVPTAILAAAVSMNATTDLDLGYDSVYPDWLPQAVQQGLVSADTIAAAVRRSLSLRFRLGDFDPASMVPFQLINASSLYTPSAAAANLQFAQKSIVLLKNTNGALPVDQTKAKNIALLGPNHFLIPNANYAGIPCEQYSLYTALQSRFANTTVNITHSSGCDGVTCPDTKQFPQALAYAAAADVIILALGLDGSMEGEGHDRSLAPCEGGNGSVFGLPGCQSQLVSAVLKAKTPSQTVVMVLFHGGGVATPAEAQDDRLGAILDAFYNGPLGPVAVLGAIFGDFVPGGKMPITIYDPEAAVEPISDYDMVDGLGRTYRYYTGKVVYGFGFGLSFWGAVPSYSSLSLSSQSIAPCASLTVSVTITAPAAGDEVVQVYVVPPKGTGAYPVPRITLQGFTRLTFTAGHLTTTVSFPLDAWSMSVTNNDGDREINPGTYTVYVGSGQPNTPGVPVLSGSFAVTGSGPVVVSQTCTNLPRKCYAC